MFDQIHKFFARFGLLEESGEVGGCSQGVLLLDTTHLHAHMLCLDHDHHAQRVQGPLDTILDLHRHTLLYLETAGEDIHYPRDLA